MCERFVSKDPFMVKYCLLRYKTQKMCDEAIDNCLSTLKSVPDCFFTDMMIRKLHEAY